MRALPILLLLLTAPIATLPATALAQGAVATGPEHASDVLSAAEAHDKAIKGEIVLVDIRHPEEWKETGVPASGYAITMHQKGADFLKQLSAAVGGDTTKPIALICATGSRTTYLQGPLKEVGFTTVLNVTEGMMGNRIGQGWLKAGLPIRTWQPGATAPIDITKP